MGDTSIEWTDKVWNPTRGCSRVSEGCRNCFAARVARRFRDVGRPFHGFIRMQPNGEPQWTDKVELVPEKLDEPLRWKKPRRIFVNSMSDLFHESLSNETIAAIFGVMALAKRHTFQVQTKRAKRMRDWFAWAARQTFGDLPHNRDPNEYASANAAMMGALCEIPASLHGFDHDDEGVTLSQALDVPWPLPNVWLGVSVEHQEAADARVPLLLGTPAAVRFLSVEPMLGPVDLGWIAQPNDEREGVIDCVRGKDWIDEAGEYDGVEKVQMPRFGGTTVFRRDIADCPRIDWVIVGGESGPAARPTHPSWVRPYRSRCRWPHAVEGPRLGGQPPRRCGGRHRAGLLREARKEARRPRPRRAHLGRDAH